MKRSLVAAAALSAAGAASAQSSVTLFGAIDGAISYYEAKSRFYSTGLAFVAPPLVAPPGIKRTQTALTGGNGISNRLGFRGTEELGGGLAASFWLEAGFASDTGLGSSPGGTFSFNRRATLSFSGGFGELRLGRDYTPSYTSDVAFDPYNNVGVGTNVITQVIQNLHTARGPGLTNAGSINPLTGVISTGSGQSASDPAVRSSNSVGYFLPPNLGGFFGQLMYALPEGVKYSDVAGTPSKRGRYYGGRFGYADGPLNLAVAYSESQAADSVGITALGTPTGTSLRNKIKIFNAAASWDFGVAKLMGEYSRVQDDAEIGVPFGPAGSGGSLSSTDKDKYTGGLIGLVVPLGPGQIRASYSRVKFDNGPLTNPLALPALALTNPDASINKLAVGYVHNLSKRTALYATAARIRIKDGQNNPSIMGVSYGGLGYLSTTGATGYAPRGATGYDLGLRHSF